MSGTLEEIFSRPFLRTKFFDLKLQVHVTVRRKTCRKYSKYQRVSYDHNTSSGEMREKVNNSFIRSIIIFLLIHLSLSVN